MSAGLGLDCVVWPTGIGWAAGLFVLYPFFSLLFFGEFQLPPENGGFPELLLAGVLSFIVACPLYSRSLAPLGIFGRIAAFVAVSVMFTCCYISATSMAEAFQGAMPDFIATGLGNLIGLGVFLLLMILFGSIASTQTSKKKAK